MEPTDIDEAFEHFFFPLSGDFDHKFCLNLRFCYPQKGIFLIIKFELFSISKDQKFDQKMFCLGEEIDFCSSLGWALRML